MSWFRSGFLAVFALAGYKFSFDPATRIVKDQLRAPDTRLIYCFTINVPPRAIWRDWSFVELSEPRCYAVMFGSYVLMYPLEGDVDFYRRVEEETRARDSGGPEKTTTATCYELARYEPFYGYPIPEA
jgi:hypothetical protein